MKAVHIAAAQYDRAHVAVFATDLEGRVWWRMIHEDSDEQSAWLLITDSTEPEGS